jgi:hydrogenase maturation protease
MASDDTHIICFGNELHGDDGVGPAVHALLATKALPPGVRLMRADVAGLAAIGCFDGCRRAVVVDALRGFGAPGSVHDLDALPLADEASRDEASGGFHGAGVGALLRLLPVALEHLPEIRLIGIEIESTTPFSPGLSAPVAGSIAMAARKVMEQLP